MAGAKKRDSDHTSMVKQNYSLFTSYGRGAHQLDISEKAYSLGMASFQQSSALVDTNIVVLIPYYSCVKLQFPALRILLDKYMLYVFEWILKHDRPKQINIEPMLIPVLHVQELVTKRCTKSNGNNCNLKLLKYYTPSILQAANQPILLAKTI